MSKTLSNILTYLLLLVLSAKRSRAQRQYEYNFNLVLPVRFCEVRAAGGSFRSLPPPRQRRNGYEFSDAIFTKRYRVYSLDFDDLQLMTVFEPEIKMAAINQKKA